ncbi:hypothetical protein HanPSC8_Chr06g0245351 [Helianthus annuus]|nr:hypothetical protein HanPSC8_Chr06g0245351 [Helianthus annuus]
MITSCRFVSCYRVRFKIASPNCKTSLKIFIQYLLNSTLHIYNSTIYNYKCNQQLLNILKIIQKHYIIIS